VNLVADYPYISCQISFYPLYTKEVGEKVLEVIALIEESGLETESNAVATIVYGRSNEIFALLEKISRKMDEEDVDYAMNCSISNTCGCEI